MIKPEHLPLSMKNRINVFNSKVQPEVSINTYNSSEDKIGEKEKLLRMLQKYGGHRGNTAKALGIDRTTLWRRIKKLGIT